jgi:hypothetical protein
LVKPEGWTAPCHKDLVFDCESITREELLEKCKTLTREKLDKNLITKDELRNFITKNLYVENFAQLNHEGLIVLYKNLIKTN